MLFRGDAELHELGLVLLFFHDSLPRG
jgi:hypothetical protein